MNKSDLEEIMKNEMTGKNAAIHAYDKMIWTVRTGFLTLAFAGWGLLIKSAVESKSELVEIDTYLYLLGITTLVLAVSGFLIDRNYARRKFRVITAANELVRLWLTTDPTKISNDDVADFVRLFQISGDAANDTYKSGGFKNEIFVSRIIYLLPSILITILIVYLLMESQS